MEADKPFSRGIEVLDRRSGQMCKVACMSCIRGHRTTSCGIPVCRTKIFWTVKRPGRPSNTCTCRFGASGRCTCMTARNACPHKPRKGEKRSGECRCDEQARFCCLLDPEHWIALLGQQTPTVDLFHTREHLQARQTNNLPLDASMTPSSLRPTSPQALASCCGGAPAVSVTPFSDVSTTSMHVFALNAAQSAITPRFGFIGIGAPQGNSSPAPAPLTWEGEAPPAPRDRCVPYPTEEEEQPASCCGGGGALYAQPTSYQRVAAFNSQPSPQMQGFDRFDSSAADAYHAQPPTFDLDRWMEEYYSHQLPAAHCQQCGRNGCTCRNCPPPMQNYGNTSWAQSCGRRHSMLQTQRPVAAVHTIQQRGAPMPAFEQALHHAAPPPPQHAHYAHSEQAASTQPLFPDPAYQPQLSLMSQSGQVARHTHQSQPPEPDFDRFDLDGALPIHASPMDLSDFLMSELDKPSHGWSADVMMDDSRAGSSRPP